MKTALLSSVAAAALALAGVATAQTMKQDEAPGRAPAAQQNAPAEKTAPPMNAGERKAPSPAGETNREKAAPHDAKTMDRAPSSSAGADRDKMGEPGEKKGGKSTVGAGSEEKGEKPAMKGKSSPTAAEEKSKATSGETSTTRSGNKMEERDRNAGTTEHRERSTVAQGSAAGLGKLSTEQRTKIVTVFKEHKVAPVRLNVSIRVGQRIPSSVHLYPVPVEVVEVYPEWRGYYYVMVGDEILIISPRTHEIVAILEV